MSQLLRNKTAAFAIRIVNMSKFLKFQMQEYEISKQVKRSGTSIGANVAESQSAQSPQDYISKLEIALKEGRETAYWLYVLRKTNYLSDSMHLSISKDLNEIIALLVTIIKRKKQNLNKL